MSVYKIIFLLGLLFAAQAYTEENHVLILTADDFPSIIEEFPYILIEFYAPWCGHCKKLTPIYDEVAKELHDAQSAVRVAKIDADEHSSVKGTYGVQGFPTLLFFNKGQQIKYSGQRTKEVMVNWLSKKTRPSIISIEADKLADIAADGKVNIVLHGEADGEHGKALQVIAAADDYNTYYAVKGTDKKGTVEIFRPFADSVNTQVSEDLKNWIGLHERPTVYPFDDRTIGTIFGGSGVGVILFHSAEAGQALAEAFRDAAEEVRVKQGKNQLIFTDIEISAEHYGGLANYIKIATPKSPIVVIDGTKRAKFVLEANPVDLTTEKIIQFVESVETGNAKEYKMDEEVVYEDGEKVETEL